MLDRTKECSAAISIIKITDKNRKSDITRSIMHALPQWFSPPEDIEKKAVIHRDFPFFAAFDGDEPVGFITLKIHNEYTAEIHVTGILKEYHHTGIGRQLLHTAVTYLKERDFLFLTVRTLDASADYEPYEKTRAFYRACGFYPLEVFPLFWDEENPCLFLVKYIGT